MFYLLIAGIVGMGVFRVVEILVCWAFYLMGGDQELQLTHNSLLTFWWNSWLVFQLMGLVMWHPVQILVSNELDFVFSTIVVGSIVNFSLMYMSAPTMFNR